MSPTVLVERDGHIAHLILNRPESLNAIDNTLGEELGWSGLLTPELAARTTFANAK